MLFVMAEVDKTWATLQMLGLFLVFFLYIWLHVTSNEGKRKIEKRKREKNKRQFEFQDTQIRTKISEALRASGKDPSQPYADMSYQEREEMLHMIAQLGTEEEKAQWKRLEQAKRWRQLLAYKREREEKQGPIETLGGMEEVLSFCGLPLSHEVPEAEKSEEKGWPYFCANFIKGGLSLPRTYPLLANPPKTYCEECSEVVPCEPQAVGGEGGSGPGPALVTVECAKCGEPYCSVTCRDKAAAAHARHCPANPL